MTDRPPVFVGATGLLGSAILGRLRSAGVPVVAVARDAAALTTLTATDDGVIACPADIGSATAEDLIRSAVPGPVLMVVQAAGLPGASRRRTPAWPGSPTRRWPTQSLSLRSPTGRAGSPCI